ncbi:MAG: hypothetical protein N4J56_008071 [Chroococcidiopsis sp. SAG 2025]|nr:hypothetical protein [Chroococcidiopsis sp. SAG 2025]
MNSPTRSHCREKTIESARWNLCLRELPQLSPILGQSYPQLPQCYPLLPHSDPLLPQLSFWVKNHDYYQALPTGTVRGTNW